MTKVNCYLGQIEALAKYLYNPHLKKAIRLGKDGEILETQQVLEPLLGTLYKREGKIIEIEEEDFNNIYNKFEQIENLRKETKGLLKFILNNSK